MRIGTVALVVASALALLTDRPARAADEYSVDASHSAVVFRISHAGLSWVYGRFNDVSGDFKIDPDAGSCAFELQIKTDSVDTGNKQRDNHLRSPDFFNVKQYPMISFKSTAVKPIEDGYEVTGDFTLHGVTKSITFALKGGRTIEMMGKRRTGYSTELTLKRSEYGMEDRMPGFIGDVVHVAVSFEGVKK
jgi:polyisoprenoid-binding protein YceI